MIKFKHSGNAGDIIYSLASIKHLCSTQNTKATLYIHLNQPLEGQEGVMVSPAMFDFIHPLINAQDYISECLPYKGEDIDYDMDIFRDGHCNTASGNIAQWYSLYYPEMQPDLSQPWIKWGKTIKTNLPLVCRTPRYNNKYIDYTVIGKGNFVGLEKEWQRMDVNPNQFERKEVSNALELAQLIAGSSYLLANQTMAFAIAEGMKHKRILEQYYEIPNVIPQGGEWFIFNTQTQLFKILLYLQHYGRN